ncbi:MAG: hypothetical protein V4599_14220 [Verrucomicrobiota bacterium]
MWHRAKDLRFLLLGLPALAVAAGAFAFLLLKGKEAQAPKVSLSPTLIEVMELPASVTSLEVRPVLARGPGAVLMGTSKTGPGSLRFEPALPLLAGQTYQVQWQEGRETVTWTAACPAGEVAVPTVRLLPVGVALPANALKLYLQFSELMEQGAFLDKLRLLDAAGQEISGPFRETELWSPDGQRLTVWFHPGRQKTGVNLNVEEGPVLEAGRACTLVVDGSWRSAAGVALGKKAVFSFTAGGADHDCPQPERWRLALPKAGSREALRVTFDEPLDTAMLAGALKVYQGPARQEVRLKVTVAASGLEWSAVPEVPWQAGSYELSPDPLLEDLAGNSLSKTFEVNVQEPGSLVNAATLLRRFEIH